MIKARRLATTRLNVNDTRCYGPHSTRSARPTGMLRYFSRCCTYQAIAEVTGAPVGTVRSRLNRVRARLGL